MLRIQMYKVMTFVGVAFGFGDIVFLQISLSDYYIVHGEQKF